MNRILMSCLGLGLTVMPLLAQTKLSSDGEDNGSEHFLYLFLAAQSEKNSFTFKPQLDLAEASGVDKFTFYCSTFPMVPEAAPSDWKKTDQMISLFLQGKATSKVAPRIALMANVGDAGLTAENAIRWKDGGSNLLSWTSPKVQDAALEVVRSVVEHCEASPAAPRIWAYHLAAQQTGEWVIPGYQTHGPDCSTSSRDAFREWLGREYASDQAFQKAWGNASLLRSQATVPLDEEGRYSMRKPTGRDVVEAFYRLPLEQNWVDYSKFASDTNAECIRKLAKQVKLSTQGKKKVIVFYGYVFDLWGSICGHLRAGTLLSDPNIDFLAAPISYTPYSQRLAGGAGGAMGAVDSIPLHGKVWISEDDLHTHAQLPGVVVPDWYWDPRNPEYSVPADLSETTGILKRNLAFTAFHHAAIWWMDLIGGGWFSDPGLWKIWDGPYGQALRKIRKEALPYAPTVAVIVDEESRFYERFTWTFRDMYPPLRNALMGCGTTVGFYYLEDYLAGKVPATAATVFVNLWHLNNKRLAQLDQQVKHRGGVVIWQYAPGFLNSEKDGVDGVQALTGIQVTTDKGRLGSRGVNELDGVAFGGLVRISPRIVISDAGATPISRYTTDQLISGAIKTTGGIRHVLLADCNWTPELMHRLLTVTKVPLATSAPAVVHGNEAALFVYAINTGELRVQAPAGKSFEDGEKEKVVKLNRNESLLFNLK